MLVKLKLDGFRDIAGAVPLPKSPAEPVPAFELMLRVPVREPMTTGVKVTPTLQLDPAPRAIDVEQVVVAASRLKSPVAAMPAISVAVLPTLVTVIVLAGLVVATA